MLGHDGGEPARHRQGEQPEAIDLRLLALDHAPEIGMAGDLCDRLMQAFVERMELIESLGGGAFALARDQSAQRRGLRPALQLSAACRAVSRSSASRIAIASRTAGAWMRVTSVPIWG